MIESDDYTNLKSRPIRNGYWVENLTGKGRPSLDNYEQFASKLKARAIKIVKERIGEHYFNLMVDTNYRYPHYYNNVYFNSAPSRMDYNVVFWLYKQQFKGYHFGLTFEKSTLKLITPIENLLPDCKNNPSECVFISYEEAHKIGQGELKPEFVAKGYTQFYFNSDHKTFVWQHRSSRSREKRRFGETATVIIDANTGRILSSVVTQDRRPNQ